MTFTFEAIVFHTSRLPEIRAFYENKLEFPIGTFEKDGKTLPDLSETYVNYQMAGGLIGFELGKEANSGDLVLKVAEFEAFKEKVKLAGIPIKKEASFFFKISDPEGRGLIFEPTGK